MKVKRMAQDFRSARYWAGEMVDAALFDGAQVIDATMGNGHDTLWLCERVGDEGRVYAFDIQEQAVENTRARLTAAGLAHRAVLFCLGHERMAEAVSGPVDAVVFNLGWLPGAPHAVTTRTETTLQAAEAGLRLLKPGGLMTLCVYPGHPEGARELAALTAWATALDPMRYDAMIKRYLNQPNDPPQLIAVRRRPAKR